MGLTFHTALALTLTLALRGRDDLPHCGSPFGLPIVESTSGTPLDQGQGWMARARCDYGAQANRLRLYAQAAGTTAGSQGGSRMGTVGRIAMARGMLKIYF